ncbi:BarP protein, putative [Trypanosoma vivax Y486]|uniref:BarP protein, putative n=1 Tax=Trypanosoma vivax (strain Y486) TaxID=1055687 RepID=F9WM12_TRYVY|nr:BarP protein, putative [Trypanosoma vivax Y486]|eukprot:CCD18562.1 BarP protein, putative [Trypanosoma vivax Y486]
MCLPPCILRANVARPLTAVLRTLLPPPLSPSPASHYSPFPLPICGVAASCYTPQLHTQDTSQHMMTVRATCLLTAALCCACALVRTHEGDHDGHEKGEAGDGNGDHGNKEMTVEEVKTMCVLLKQLRGVSPSVEALVTRANNSLSTISRYKAKEDSALEEARRGGSNETVQKHESRATAVGNAYATAAAAVLSVPDLAANITAASTTIINEIVESLDDLEKSEASEEVKEAGRPCAAAPADSGVTSQSLDGVREAIVKKAAEDDGAELVEEANSVLGHLAAQLRELEAAVATAAGAEADAKAASESSAGAMSLVVAAAALLLGARL